MAVPSRTKLFSSNKYEKTVLQADDPLGVGLMPAETEEQRMRRNERGIKKIQKSNLIEHLTWGSAPSWMRKMGNYFGLGGVDELADVIENREKVDKSYNNPGALMVNAKNAGRFKKKYGAEPLKEPKNKDDYQLLIFKDYETGRQAQIDLLEQYASHPERKDFFIDDFVDTYVAGGTQEFLREHNPKSYYLTKDGQKELKEYKKAIRAARGR